ncbi:MAG: radical SAM protein [Thermodesulfovibrionales bacterium]|nr:radical SAM protein [Thermodesulfovibrionales bacterium]
MYLPKKKLEIYSYNNLMKVCEIFVSIQGESSYVGLPCIFIRLSGCNLRCSYCDTSYAYEEGIELMEEEIYRKIKEYGVRLVEITGGEPLLQYKEVLPFIDRVIRDGFKVLIETNGSQSIKNINTKAVIIMDIKTPGSGMHEKMYLKNLDFIKKDDEIKFVLTDRYDYEWAKEFSITHNLFDKCKVLFSPAYKLLSPYLLAKWIIEDKLSVRLNIQLHKYIFGDGLRGV